MNHFLFFARKSAAKPGRTALRRGLWAQQKQAEGFAVHQPLGESMLRARQGHSSSDGLGLALFSSWFWGSLLFSLGFTLAQKNSLKKKPTTKQNHEQRTKASKTELKTEKQKPENRTQNDPKWNSKRPKTIPKLEKNKKNLESPKQKIAVRTSPGAREGLFGGAGPFPFARGGSRLCLGAALRRGECRRGGVEGEGVPWPGMFLFRDAYWSYWWSFPWVFLSFFYQTHSIFDLLIPRPSNYRCFLEAFKELKNTKKQ